MIVTYDRYLQSSLMFNIGNYNMFILQATDFLHTLGLFSTQ
jgi:hypothetical protein